MKASRNPDVCGLHALAKKARQTASAQGGGVRTHRLPRGMSLNGSRYVQFGLPTVRAVERASKALSEDLRFEHLEKTNDLLWDMAVQARLRSDEDVAGAFIERNEREVLQTVCFIPVHRLHLTAEAKLLGLRLIPISSAEVPTAGTFMEHEGEFHVVAAVPVSGTGYAKMAERARREAGNALRILRNALTGRSILPQQLRFRLGTSYAFPGELRGWNARTDVSYGLELTAATLADLNHAHLEKLASPSNPLEEKASLALGWMERARFSGEPLIEVLYLMFALEALLGDADEGLKSAKIARRQLLLSHIMTGGLLDPNQTMALYEEVRSKAVHGGAAGETTRDEAESFHRSVKMALDQYLQLAESKNITTQRALTAVLDSHEDNPSLLDWLRMNGGANWEQHFKYVERASERSATPEV